MATRVSGDRAQRFLADAEDDELGGPDDRNADEANQPGIIEVVLRHDGVVAFQQERLRFMDGFEDSPLRPRIDGSSDVGEIAPDGDVLTAGPEMSPGVDS